MHFTPLKFSWSETNLLQNKLGFRNFNLKKRFFIRSQRLSD